MKSVIFWNNGTTNNVPFLDISGDHDVGNTTVAGISGNTDMATQPGAWIFYHQILMTGGNSTGHLVLMEQPDRVWEMAVKWWQWQLNGDDDAKKEFVGDSCTLCNRASEFDYDVNSLVQ